MTVSKPHASSLQIGQAARRLVGSVGHLVIFLWSLGIILLTPLRGGFLLAGICLVLLSLLYPSALQRILRPRWLILLAACRREAISGE
ncbi:MAG: hypothetical protein KJ606_10840 [Chloroflexi bacterium]|nr:hypothetical protein [Chloroflexota bacterium]